MFEGLTPAHLILLLAIALVIFGPGKLPEAGAAFGKAIRGFREAANGVAEPPTPTPAPPAQPTSPSPPDGQGSSGPEAPPTN